MWILLLTVTNCSFQLLSWKDKKKKLIPDYLLCIDGPVIDDRPWSMSTNVKKLCWT